MRWPGSLGGVLMSQAVQPDKPRCPNCQGPLGHSIEVDSSSGRELCPECGRDITTPDNAEDADRIVQAIQAELAAHEILRNTGSNLAGLVAEEIRLLAVSLCDWHNGQVVRPEPVRPQ